MKRNWLITLSTPIAFMACGSSSSEPTQTSQRNLDSFQQAVDIDDARTAGDRAAEVANTIGDKSAQTLETAKAKASEAWTNTKGTARDAWNASLEAATNVFNGASDKSKSAAESTKDGMSDAKDATADKASSATDSISDKLSDMKDTISDKAGDAKDAVSDTAGDAKDAINDKADDTSDAAVDAKDSAANELNSRGHEPTNGLVDRIHSAYEKSGARYDLRDFASDNVEHAMQDLYEFEESRQDREEDRADQILHEGDVAFERARRRGETALDRGADAAEDAADDVADVASSMSERAKNRASDASQYVRDSAHEASETVKRNARRAHDNVKNHEETLRQNNLRTYNKGASAVHSAWDTVKHDARIVTTPANKVASFTADRFQKNAAWANQVRKDAVAWERSRRTWLEKKVVSNSGAVSGYLAGLFSGTVEGAKNTAHNVKEGTKNAAHDVKEGTKNTAYDVKEGTKNKAHDVKEGSKNASADALRKASDKLDDAADHVEGTEDYSSIGLTDVPDAHMGFALGVELFADRICDGLRDTRQLNADEMADCLNHQRKLYTWYYGAKQCRENGFKTELLSDCLALAPETAGGRKGEPRGYTAPFNQASRTFYWNCRASNVCAP